ncbi:Cys/Met metabolism pyridoxal-phosphate-dependent enzyme [Paracoccus sp. M683]|uniref:PepSY domain-containing protein n=1 Tax=Paracoccus sp. M683 TaxID=2594268 RepID=UPI0011808540|nr:Cys/Met metabolism pyridoxal-phosphate-dependent enzyme [Paracoccus sp. M683]TRW92139.1 Cys/Met metabolism pyridoxal-phosphate-dependent enzyme [Paracoccus sp. M683]
MRPILIALFLLLTAPPLHAEEDFRPLPLHEAARLVAERYQGRLLAARLTPPTRHERDLGVELVTELRLLTPARNLLAIRLDARNGRFLDVAGVGQTEALKR